MKAGLMTEGAGIRRVLAAVGYPPDEVPSVVASSFFTADSLRCRIVPDGGSVRFEFPIGAVEDGELMDFGSLAAGRIPKDDAVLAYDPVEGAAFIWQRVSRLDDNSAIRRDFESFSASAEWWHDRLAKNGPSEEQTSPEDMTEVVIRP